MRGANSYAQKTESINAEASQRELKRNADTTLLHQRFNVENKGNYLYPPLYEG